MTNPPYCWHDDQKVVFRYRGHVCSSALPCSYPLHTLITLRQTLPMNPSSRSICPARGGDPMAVSSQSILRLFPSLDID